MSGSIPAPDLAHGFRPTPNVGPVWDPTVGISAADQLLKVKQQQDQMGRQNALMSIFQDPNTIDPTGQPTADAMKRIYAVDPRMGLEIAQNSMAAQDRRIRMEYFKSKAAAENNERIGNALTPVVTNYQENLKTMTPAEANKIAEGEYKLAYDSLQNGGFPPDALKLAPQGWDPVKVGLVVQQTEAFRNWHKDQLAERRVTNAEDKERDISYNRNTTEEVDNEGRPYTHRPNAPVGQQNLYDDGTAVPPDKRKGATKMGAPGRTSEKTAENQRITDGARFDYEKKLGHPVDPNDPEQVNELKKLQQAAIDKHEADRKRDNAAAATSGKNAAGGGSAAQQDRAAQVRLATADVEERLGHKLDLTNPTGPDQRALDNEVLRKQADRKVEIAGQTAAARQEWTSKPTPVTVNGKAQDAVWKKQQWFNADGTPIPPGSDVRLAARPAIGGSPAAEKKARFDEMKAAQQEAGTYKNDTEVFRALDQQLAEDKQTAISDDAAKIAAQVSLITGRPPAWMGRSQASLNKFLDAYAKEAKEQKLTAKDIAANIAKFSGELAEARSLGTMSARVDFAAKELDVALPTAMASSEKVWRPGFKAVAEIQQAIKGQVSDPDLLEFAQFNQQVISAYGAAMNRGGLSTVHAQERAEHLLSTATSHDGYMRQLDTLHKEVQTILYGTEAAKGRLASEITGRPEETKAPTLTGVPRPGEVKIPASLSDLDKAGKLAHNQDGSVFYNKETKQYFDGTGKEIPAPGSEAKPAPPIAPRASAIPLPPKPTAENLVNDQVYETTRGRLKWDSAQKKFFPVREQ